MSNLNTKLFWDVVHYKVNPSTGEETTISVHKGIHVNTAKKLKLKAQRNGYKYNRGKREYTKQVGEVIHHLIFA